MFSYSEAVSYINGIPKFTSKNEAGNTRELMRRLGDPQRSFPVIHVAGTNGKGSVCAFMDSVLRHAGLKTGLFTSPHLVRINERFQIGRESVSDDQFLSCFERVKTAVDAMVKDGFKHPTYFEYLFAMGMLAFRDEKIQILVMETGLGGRLDATNIVESPKVCVITSIGLDHTEYLGGTIGEIAGEKAGIIKENVPVVYDASDERAGRVIAERAAALHAPAIPVYPHICRILSRSRQAVTYRLQSDLFEGLEVTVPFGADYQVMNSAVALTALRTLDPEKRISDSLMTQAVLQTKWSGRMQQAVEGIIFDGAHNPDGVRQLCDAIRQTTREGEAALLFSAVSDKAYTEMIRELCGKVRFAYIVVTRIPGGRGVDAGTLAAVFAECTDAPVCAAEDPKEAFRLARDMRKPDQTLFCAGSLYLIGELEKELEKL